MATIETLLTGFPLLVLDRRATALEAARAMAERKVGATMIVDASGRPAGVFTERDLMTRVIVAGLDPARVALDQVMSRRLLFARCDERVADVESEMQRAHVRHLPIVDAGGRLVGVVSFRDLLREDLRQRTAELDELHNYIASPDSPQ